jgi:methylenetetrahydrofolate dehydrogenase (NADP+)/methenyltetrahydrofolate cyclohydrolase
VTADARVIDGKAIALEVRAEVRERATELAAAGVVPGLTVVLVGDDPASQVYVRNKDRAAEEAGFAVRTRKLRAETTQAELEKLVRELNADSTVHGILVQLPLPATLDAQRIIELIDPKKDVDGLHPHNVALLALGRPGLVPCTPLGCIELLDRSSLPIEGAHVVVVGRSMLVGKPLAHLVKGDWIRRGAAVIDVGINRMPDGKLAGDVDFEAARLQAGAITPVPGGVGPMTIAMLLSNTVLAAARQTGHAQIFRAKPGRASLSR